MLPSTDIDNILLNGSLVVLWQTISFQSVYFTIFSINLDLIAVNLKVLCISVQ